jgi:multisubunit Na+/H+ antiporter MnhF subunit
VNGWLAIGTGFLASLVPAGAVCLRGDAADRLVGLEFAAVALTLGFEALAMGFGRPSFVDLALATAVTSFGGGMVFARFLERWL